MSGHQETGGDASLVCAFAVTDSTPDDVDLVVPGHEEGGPLRVLDAGGLSVVVQDVPAALFGEAALRERLERPAELERCARAHHRGVEAAARRGAAVPLPLATLYRGDGAARRAVAARAAEFGALLDLLGDRTEWAVKAHAAEAAPGDAEPAGDGGGGRAYLGRASARNRARRDAHGRALAEAEAVDAELRRFAVAATRHRPQGERLTGRRAPQLFNAAYLVDDAARPAFTRALERIAGRGGAVTIDASGPWVPYSFARAAPAADPERTGAGA
ncbi:GvpL/GvpF family gas vesicle protein [Streptomyces sp. NPDC003717]|uniref:GvpL/GvpF family gas vesicle protein n=1 Tax=Streptomyces sp. NPDC003717 TaxID=3154276 RepID=UPI0033B45272